jgi:hypothetical protein
MTYRLQRPHTTTSKDDGASPSWVVRRGVREAGDDARSMMIIDGSRKAIF